MELNEKQRKILSDTQNAGKGAIWYGDSQDMQALVFAKLMKPHRLNCTFFQITSAGRKALKNWNMKTAKNISQKIIEARAARDSACASGDYGRGRYYSDLITTLELEKNKYL